MNKDDSVIVIQEYYKKHIQEEVHHDELLLEDLESIGYRRKELLIQKPLQEVAALVGSQFYWINYLHWICLLGYISVLEGNPPNPESISKLQKSTGYPNAAFRTIVKHSTLDPYHRDDLNNLLDSLPLNQSQEKWITSNSLYTANKLWEIRNRQC